MQEEGELPCCFLAPSLSEPKPHAYLSLAMPRESAEGHGRAKLLSWLVGQERFTECIPRLQSGHTITLQLTSVYID